MSRRIRSFDEFLLRQAAKDKTFLERYECGDHDAVIQAVVAHARIIAGLTQRQLANALKTPQPSVARWENGRAIPTLAVLYRLARACGVVFVITPEIILHVRRYGDEE